MSITLTTPRTTWVVANRLNIDVISSGNTTVSIPVTIGNIQAIKAVATLVRKGSLTLSVNGSALIDVRVTSFEKRFEQSREFQLRDFASLIPADCRFRDHDEYHG